MGDNTEPDWLTDMDLEILDVLSTNLVLSPSIIAENIDRSREGVSNRLNSLQAGELVEKVERGKYQITEEGSRVYVGKEEYGKDDWYSPEKLGWDEEDQERLAEIREELNVSEKEFQLRVRNEYNSIIREGSDFEDPLREAEKRVIERLRDKEN